MEKYHHNTVFWENLHLLLINGKINLNVKTVGGLHTMCPWCAWLHRKECYVDDFRTEPPGGLGDGCSLQHILGDTLKGDDSGACFCLNFGNLHGSRETWGRAPGTWREGGRASFNSHQVPPDQYHSDCAWARAKMLLQAQSPSAKAIPTGQGAPTIPG